MVNEPLLTICYQDKISCKLPETPPAAGKLSVSRYIEMILKTTAAKKNRRYADCVLLHYPYVNLGESHRHTDFNSLDLPVKIRCIIIRHP